MHLVLSLRPGGRGTTILDLCQHADRTRFDPFVCCLEEQGRPDAELRGARVVVLGKRPGLDLAAVPRLARLMRHEGVRLVHAHEAAALFYGAPAGRLAGRVAVVNTYHRSNDTDIRGRRDRIRNRLALRMTAALTAVSESNRRVFAAAHGLDPGRVRVIHSAIDTSRITQLHPDVARIRAQLGIPHGRRVVGAVGHMNGPDKGHDNLLRAFARARDRMPEACLVLCGDGPLRRDLQDLSRQLRLERDVFFTGFYPDVLSLYHAFDLFVLASIREAFGLVVVEAMCAGKPVVATNVGGIPDIVREGITGLLVPPADDEALASAVLRVLGDDRLAADMGRAGRQRAERHFSLPRMVGEYEALYTELLEGTADRRR